MEWFAMSSKFYIDLDDAGVSEAAQTFLARALGYVADNELGGFLPVAATKKLGLARVPGRIEQLEREGIMVRVCTVSVSHPCSIRVPIRDLSSTSSASYNCSIRGWDFPAWLKWNEPLERLVRKRKRDRETVAEKRRLEENVVRQSRNVAEPQGQEQLPIPSTNCVEVSPVSIAPAPEALPDGGLVGWCERHPGGTAARCRPCGDARRAKEAWEAEQAAAAKSARSSERHEFAHARALAIADCGLCDDQGYMGTVVCDHRPDVLDAGSRGMDLIRREMGWEA